MAIAWLYRRQYGEPVLQMTTTSTERTQRTRWQSIVGTIAFGGVRRGRRVTLGGHGFFTGGLSDLSIGARACWPLLERDAFRGRCDDLDRRKNVADGRWLCAAVCGDDVRMIGL